MSDNLDLVYRVHVQIGRKWQYYNHCRICDKPIPRPSTRCIECYCRERQSPFWSHITIGKPDECWEWQAAKMQNGYGELRFNGKTVYAHRLAYELTYGAIPKGTLICHRCNNAPCVNPLHLYAGTPADNVHDAMHAGTNYILPCLRGESNPCAKLTNAAVCEIRQLYAVGGISQTQLARRFNVHQSLIWLVIHHKIWTHI